MQPIFRKMSRQSTTGLSASVNKAPPFKPYAGNPLDPIDVCVDAFLSSTMFEMICAQATQLAAILPTDPPPALFASFSANPMHHWYYALLMEFLDCFMRRLRHLRRFPTRPVFGTTPNARKITIVEDANAFNTEATAHMHAILLSFNIKFRERSLGSMSGLRVDTRQPNASIAKQALHEARLPAKCAPKRNWKVGEGLASEYKRRLRMFEIGVMRLMAEQKDHQWMLKLPKQMNRGIAAYKEYYIMHLREQILAVRAKQHDKRDGDGVFI